MAARLYRWLLVLAALHGSGTVWASAHWTAADSVAIYVVNHGYHVGIVVPTESVSLDAWPEMADFPGATYLEVGWGDAAFYQSPDPGVGTTLRAGVWPTSSVLHIVGLTEHPAAAFSGSEVLSFIVERPALDRLIAFVSDEAERDEAGHARMLGDGLYGESRFYAARRTYHVFFNCNHWSARALRIAGVPLRGRGAMTADALMRRLRAIGG